MRVGHAIGLGHENVFASIMGAFADPSLKGLTGDDINGAQAIYGNSPNPGQGDNDDIFPDGVTTNGAISVPGTATGTANAPLDDDFFAVDLVAGRQYQFDVIGGTLPEPIVRVVNPDFTELSSFGFDGVEGVDHRVFYIAETTGTYFVGVRGNNNTIGTYTLTAADLGATVPGLTISEGSGDAVANTSTAQPIIPGDSFEGTLSDASDQDWIQIDLLPGRFYTFELQGVDSDGGPLLIRSSYCETPTVFSSCKAMTRTVRAIPVFPTSFRISGRTTSMSVPLAIVEARIQSSPLQINAMKTTPFPSLRSPVSPLRKAVPMLQAIRQQRTRLFPGIRSMAH